MDWLDEILQQENKQLIKESITKKLEEQFVDKKEMERLQQENQRFLEKEEQLEQQFQQYQKNQQQLEEYKKELDKQQQKVQLERKQAAVDMEILKAGGKSLQAIRGFIDLDKVELEENGTVLGLDLESLKQSEGYLFHQSSESIRGLKATLPHPSPNPFLEPGQMDFETYKNWRNQQ